MNQYKYDQAKNVVLKRYLLKVERDTVQEMILRSEHPEWHTHSISIEGHKINGVSIPQSLELPILYMINREIDSKLKLLENQLEALFLNHDQPNETTLDVERGR